MKNLEAGAHQFKAKFHAQNRPLFERLAGGQKPETLFITCADSRVVPSLITTTNPGELFMVRNVGNIVPPFDRGAIGGVAAALEYGVQVLKVRQIVVCGHSQCGAVGAILHPDHVASLPLTAKWVQESRSVPERTTKRYGELEGDARTNAATEENVRLQLENLRTFDFIAEKVDAGTLSLHGWVFHIASGDVFVHDPATGKFAPTAAPAGATA